MTTKTETDTKRVKSMTKKRFVGYLRVSMEKDATGSFTFETQRQYILTKLQQKYGEEGFDVTFLEDDGLSGGFGLNANRAQKHVRPTLQKIAKMIEDDEVDGVIVYAMNRLFRNTRGLMELIEDVLLPNKKELLSATEDTDINSAQGRMMLYMTGLFDQKVREDIVKRNRDAAATRANSGYPIGQVGYGWIWNPQIASGSGQRRGIVPVETEQHWLLHIKERYLSGWNAGRIAGELNELEVPSPMQRALWSSKAKKQRTRDGREPRWTSSTVWNVLRNPLHAGLIKTPDDERINGQHYEQRYWDPEVLDQIEASHIERLKRFKTCTGSSKQSHLLSGLIYCDRCGRRLYIASVEETSKNYRSYRCLNGVQQGQATCSGMTVRAEWVERAVVEVIAKLSKEPAMRRLLEKEAKQGATKQDAALGKEKIQVKHKLDQIEERFERWAEGYSKGNMTDKQFKVYSDRITVEETEASARLEEIEAMLANKVGRELRLQQVREHLENFTPAWEHLDNDEKRQVLSLLLEDGGLKADREGRDIILKIKVQMLPEQERRIMYGWYRGVNRTKATGLQLLTKRQMVLLHYTYEGNTQRQCAQLMKCKPSSINSIKETICKNLGDVSWEKALEMCRERVQSNLAQLPLGQPGKNVKMPSPSKPFITPVLLEVFEYFAKGASVTDTAERCGLSPVTVQGRRSRILKLMGTSSMLEAVEKAKEWGILAG